MRHQANDPFTHQLHEQLKTTAMGLGLARLLLDAGRTEEARATLASLQDGFQGADEALPSEKPFESDAPPWPQPSFAPIVQPGDFGVAFCRS